MLTDEEKESIIERVKFENQLRKEAFGGDEKSSSSSFSWIESKLGLLIIAALISGVLVPLFQFSQETIKWSRQNRYDNLKHRLEMTRNSMKELTLAHAFAAEAYERSRTLINSENIDKEALKKYKNQMLEMHNRRFKQNAKFVSLLSYFPEDERWVIRKSFQRYLSSVQASMMLLENTVAEKYNEEIHIPVVDNYSNNFYKQSQSLTEKINLNYEEILDFIRSYLGELENEGEHYM